MINEGFRRYDVGDVLIVQSIYTSKIIITHRIVKNRVIDLEYDYDRYYFKVIDGYKIPHEYFEYGSIIYDESDFLRKATEDELLELVEEMI